MFGAGSLLNPELVVLPFLVIAACISLVIASWGRGAEKRYLVMLWPKFEVVERKDYVEVRNDALNAPEIVFSPGDDWVD